MPSDGSLDGRLQERVSTSSLQILNPTRIETLRRLEEKTGESLIDDLVRSLLGDLPGVWEKLGEASGRDRKAWNHAAHRLRGRALNLGGERLGESCRLLESMDSEEWPEACQHLMDLLSHEIEALRPRLETILEGDLSDPENRSMKDVDAGSHRTSSMLSTIPTELLPLLARAVETMSFGLTITGNDGRILLANPADARMHGYESEELRGRSSAILGPRAVGLGEAIDLPQPWIRETVNLRKDGSEFPVRLTSDVVENAQGMRLGTVTICEDLEEEISNREALEASEAAIRSFLESTSDLFQVTGRGGRILFVNEAWRRNLGYSEEQVADLRIQDVLDTEQIETFRSMQERVLDRGESQNFQMIFRTRSGESRTLEGTATPDLSGGRVPVLRVLLRDVTGRAEVESMKDDFVGRISHELRTPLTSVLGSLKLILRGAVPDPEQQAELLEVALRQGQALEKLIGRLLEFSQISAGSLNLNIGPVPVPALLQDQIAWARGAAEARRVDLRLATPVGNLEVLADRDRLEQVLHVLVSNALEFSPVDGSVNLEATVDGDRLLLGVSDEGPGIPAEYQSEVFERFSQVGESATRTHEGIGLGLSFARALVREMGGELRLDSSRMSGSRFTVELPRA